MNADLDTLKSLLIDSRSKSIAADLAERKVFVLLEKAGVDLEHHSGKMSAEDLEQAICGYIRYGEYNIDDIETSARGACRRMRND